MGLFISFRKETVIEPAAAFVSEELRIDLRDGGVFAERRIFRRVEGPDKRDARGAPYP